ncbi:unnamed protein product [Penicillium nalgiovense]|nr:unnamed protein product [Penicillium nalgiovense]CAG7966630.1 unnamed protein product [Penicillium nalgiovense]CAG7968590.1 unnamed protein product [Penicillium nalgiovense]CAG7997935.1 unnamed protein product [Penicillium nalgiovense]CAG8023684.1 unnamed protein product [Penicillium nalgiovense]
MDRTRDHLLVVLMGATHNGNATGSVSPSHGPYLNGDSWPRYHSLRETESWEVESHGKMQPHHPTQFSSFTTWMGSRLS